jgi:hypothetical protein
LTVNSFRVMISAAIFSASTPAKSTGYDLNIIDTDINVRFIHVDIRPPQGRHDPSPIGVLPVKGGFHKARVGNGSGGFHRVFGEMRR